MGGSVGEGKEGEAVGGAGLGGTSLGGVLPQPAHRSPLRPSHPGGGHPAQHPRGHRRLDPPRVSSEGQSPRVGTAIAVTQTHRPTGTRPAWGPCVGTPCSLEGVRASLGSPGTMVRAQDATGGLRTEGVEAKGRRREGGSVWSEEGPGGGDVGARPETGQPGASGWQGARAQARRSPRDQEGVWMQGGMEPQGCRGTVRRVHMYSKPQGHREPPRRERARRC